MASLFNTLPQDTYSSLIKFIDNTGSAGPVKQLTDGAGTAFPLYLGSTVLSGSISASYAVTASYALNAGTTVSTASLLTTASSALNVLTFTKGNGSTFNVTVNTGSAATVSTASLLTTASVSLNTITFTKGNGSTFNITVDTGSGGGAVTSITNNTNDYILTATGGTTINGEGNLRFDGSALKITGSVAISSSLAIGNITPSTTVGRIDASNDIVAFSTSDIRLKENITPILNPISKIEAIGGYTFDWKPEHKDLHGFEGHDVGVIAQEIEVIMPEVVTTRDSGYKAVKYEKIVPLLIEAIKDLQKQVDELKNR
jgi:predicted Rdx family selenoprotein